MSLARRVSLKLAALAVAAAIWLPLAHLIYRPDLTDYLAESGISPKAQAIAVRHLKLWTDPELREIELRKMQQTNPEWDFMSRTFFVLALANMSLRDPALKPQALEIMEAIIDNTLRIEREKGLYHFLMSYARGGHWTMDPPRSQFLDGEIALMIAARRLIEEKESLREPLTERVTLMIDRMRQSAVLCAESYPDECWIFCNATSLAAIRLADVLDGTDHTAFINEWIATATAKLIEPGTGLLISAFEVSGRPAPAGPGPEGSSIWWAINMLQVVDEPFARQQYKLARAELGRSTLGFGYSREWPESCEEAPDVDSGPVVPGLGASAAASGLALIAAAKFDDHDYLGSLITSLNLVGFPTRSEGSELRYLASNAVGDAVLLYALVEGPLWREVERRAGR